MLIGFHPEASKSINKQADELISSITEMVHYPVYSPVNNNDVYTSEITSDRIIGEPLSSYNDINGFVIEKSFAVDRKEFGLNKLNYKKLIKMVDELYKNKGISQLLSKKYIEDNIFIWVRDSYKNGKKEDYITYLTKTMFIDIKKFEIVIPVPHTLIAKPFTLGKVNFISLTAALMDEWFRKANPEIIDKKDYDDSKEFFDERKKHFQGYAAGVFSVEAEEGKAEELAYEYFTNALCIIRLFSPANFLCELTNNTYEYGSDMLRKIIYFRISSDKEFSLNYNTSIIDSRLRWKMESEMIDDPILLQFNKLLNIERRSGYQEKLLEALIIYSRHTLRFDISDKLLNVLVALETILLRNETEPIQQNVGDRMAFLVGRTPDERKTVSAKLKEIYSIRSKFIHHGKSRINEAAMINEFLGYAWRCFANLVCLIDNFKTCEDLYNEIDKMKYS